ncbi:MAG: hypothetical protein A2504_15050 [Bdellovibrionales bacterium RIFOXYD12_FULL_39_22]|nr:MAG: hypothetical protein A2385_02480 [Bdellovibrionales bacterium RIFOXYB1_FULL_39_21]OFZ43113.1 MAG: hypothetical protein A2485_11625 [Bdellovibrionales bacterium RIFOXYC12_FULL_39_17]OFZ47851.1 MAG: hypothetical protein A2404_16265 [Bdellovibrionales bacterium RIFOXYC1_FULL_39_130]OFZ71809.1 MAG: hypothetical protein A2451_09680 [Bdellovibrionales bacterium RIFOXYC2_FULL_39_8]OFZ75631.1 MAG: hypothetical protein A2560_12765 [Bdellovibrionales bacterium RIFOXYD1_FULL_39_84]OFZ94121.1 MAG:
MKNSNQTFIFSLALVMILIVLSSSAFAEYRVYQYYLSQAQKTNRDPNGYTITSTLDPIAYQTYHGGELSIKIELLRSWMCPGYTGKMQPHCSDPLTNAEQINNTSIGP